MNNKTRILILVGLLMSSSTWAAEKCNSILDFEARKLRSSEQINFCQQFKGKVLLAVNTASECGFTPQFEGLEALYKKYKDQGLEIVGFPSDDFFQEHDDEKETADICYLNYGVSFTMLSPSSVRGSDANAFYKKLTTAADHSVKWNFFKYLVDKNGNVVGSWNSKAKPLAGEIEQAIINALK